MLNLSLRTSPLRSQDVLSESFKSSGESAEVIFDVPDVEIDVAGHQ